MSIKKIFQFSAYLLKIESFIRLIKITYSRSSANRTLKSLVTKLLTFTGNTMLVAISMLLGTAVKCD